jgi:hypothetical protein
MERGRFKTQDGSQTDYEGHMDREWTFDEKVSVLYNIVRKNAYVAHVLSTTLYLLGGFGGWELGQVAPSGREYSCG